MAELFSTLRHYSKPHQCLPGFMVPIRRYVHTSARVVDDCLPAKPESDQYGMIEIFVACSCLYPGTF
jgi:hypothetical protein